MAAKLWSPKGLGSNEGRFRYELLLVSDADRDEDLKCTNVDLASVSMFQTTKLSFRS